MADEVDDHAVGVVTFGEGYPLVDLVAMQFLSQRRTLLSHTINLPIPQPIHTHPKETIILPPLPISPLKTPPILNALLISIRLGVYNPYLTNYSLLNIISTMGGGASVNYAVPVTQKVNGESATYRSPLHKDQLIDGYGEHKTMKAILINSAKRYPNNSALGTPLTTQAPSSRTRMVSPPSTTSPTAKPSASPSRLAVPSSPKSSTLFPRGKNYVCSASSPRTEQSGH